MLDAMGQSRVAGRKSRAERASFALPFVTFVVSFFGFLPCETRAAGFQKADWAAVQGLDLCSAGARILPFASEPAHWRRGTRIAYLVIA